MYFRGAQLHVRNPDRNSDRNSKCKNACKSNNLKCIVHFEFLSEFLSEYISEAAEMYFSFCRNFCGPHEPSVPRAIQSVDRVTQHLPRHCWPISSWYSSSPAQGMHFRPPGAGVKNPMGHGTGSFTVPLEKVPVETCVYNTNTKIRRISKKLFSRFEKNERLFKKHNP